MRKFCLKISIVLLGFSVIGCSKRIQSLQSPYVPEQVRNHFAIMALDSNVLIIPPPITVEEGPFSFQYELRTRLNKNVLVGKLYKRRLKEFEMKPSRRHLDQTYLLKIKTIRCCSNHNPNDCVRTQNEAKDLTRKKGCTKWRVKIL